MPAARARVVQITDTHFSASQGVPPQWPAVLAWLEHDPPDLLVHTGDIVFEDPDDAADRAFAKSLLDQVPVPYVVIPGNHDIGFYGEEASQPRRLAAFRATWGDDRFVRDLADWRLVGVDSYRLGMPEHDEWLRAALATADPVLAFLHQPLHGEPADGWEMPAAARDAFARAADGADIRVVASGHRHCALIGAPSTDEIVHGGDRVGAPMSEARRDDGSLARRLAHSLTAGRAVWAPSLTLTTDDPVDGSDPRQGLVEHVLDATGDHEHRVVRPWELSSTARRP